MRYYILATDYDGTLAHDGVVDKATIVSLEKLRASGRQLVMVTGREITDLKSVFSRLDLFEWIVAENGAMLYRPSNQEIILLGEPPPEKFVAELSRRGAQGLYVGGCMVATWEPYQNIVLETIRDLGLELKVIFNKGAVMILPSNIDKGSGLLAALERMGFSPHEVVGVGDAENDHAFFSVCECSAAVSNALPALKERADLTLSNDHGAGVAELIDAILANDLQKEGHHISRHQFLLGQIDDQQNLYIKPYNNTLLIAGPSGSGKSTVATGLIERLSDSGYQYCIVDPEGDFATLEKAIVLGGTDQLPSIDDAGQALRKTQLNVVVNMVGMPLADRPDFFLKLLVRLLEFRAATGRPHWILVDEAHHLLPSEWKRSLIPLPQELDRLILVTVHPDQVSVDALELVKLVVAVGQQPKEVIDEFTKAVGDKPVAIDFPLQKKEQVFVWLRDTQQTYLVEPSPPRTERRRHIHKYMSGELTLEHSFFFKGPEGKLNIRAQNLMLFMQIADGVDDETWLHHIKNGDIVKWFEEDIKDRELVKGAQKVQNANLTASQSREKIRALIEQHYTLPSTSYLPLPGTAAARKS